jgi:hypothetical protein
LVHRPLIRAGDQGGRWPEVAKKAMRFFGLALGEWDQPNLRPAAGIGLDRPVVRPR